MMDGREEDRIAAAVFSGFAMFLSAMAVIFAVIALLN